MLHQHIGWKRDRGRGLGGDCNEVTTSLCSSLQCSILHIQVCWKCAWATTGFVWILDNVIAFTAASRKWLTAGYLAVCKTQFIQIQYFTKSSQHMGIEISLNMHSLLNKKESWHWDGHIKGFTHETCSQGKSQHLISSLWKQGVPDCTQWTIPRGTTHLCTV